MNNYALGIHPRIPIDDYIFDRLHESPTLSSSVANIMLDRSPAHAQLAHARFNPSVMFEQSFSKAANFGSAVHALVFGGQHIEVINADGYTTKEARAIRDRALMNGGIPLLQEEHMHASSIALHVGSALADFKCELDYEHTILFHAGKAVCRTRPDAISKDRRLIIDLKVTGTNARDANKQFFNQGYDLQAAFLERGADSLDADGIGKRTIVYLFIESEPPYAHSMLEVSEGTLTIARKKFNAAANLWARCVKEKQWPAYQSSRTITQRPAYEETAWLIREETDKTIKVEAPV